MFQKYLTYSIKIIDFLLKYILYISFLIIITFFIYKIFYDVWEWMDYTNLRLYKDFFSNFLCTGAESMCFMDRYWYGFHYLQSILVSPFLIFKFFMWELQFTWTWFIFSPFDKSAINIIFYSWKLISLFSFIGLIYFLYKIIYFFTKDNFFSLLPILLLWSISEVINYATIYRVDIALTTFCMWSLYFAIRFLEKYSIKYLMLFIFFSLFAFIIKYQSLMYISWIYIIVLFYTLINKKYKELLYWGIFFILLFLFLNFNYNLLVSNLLIRFDPDSLFLWLNQNELINLTYSLYDRLIIIFSHFKYQSWYIVYYLIISWLWLFLIFLRNIKIKYTIIILMPFLINYYIHLFVVHILSQRHYLILFSLFTLISVLWFYYFYAFLIKKYKFIYVTKILLLTLITGLFVNMYNLLDRELFFMENNQWRSIINKISIINDKELNIMHIEWLTWVPFWLDYIFPLDIYNTKRE